MASWDKPMLDLEYQAGQTAAFKTPQDLKTAEGLWGMDKDKPDYFTALAPVITKDGWLIEEPYKITKIIRIPNHPDKGVALVGTKLEWKDFGKVKMEIGTLTNSNKFNILSVGDERFGASLDCVDCWTSGGLQLHLILETDYLSVQRADATLIASEIKAKVAIEVSVHALQEKEFRQQLSTIIGATVGPSIDLSLHKKFEAKQKIALGLEIEATLAAKTYPLDLLNLSRTDLNIPKWCLGPGFV
ncbi:hypothetical protein TWF694_008087 [Orbilia ellipsospora]|uniref:Uncharacterized protein n=1 Tax=Orbilia ellipsospora TaxID=2528407 RepID=A0AAV9XF04_9PEZI